MSIKHVALVGADGNLGPAILHALVENGFTVTVLKRQSSKSPSSHSKEVRIEDDFPIDSLVDALRGQDAVVVAVRSNQDEFQQRIADACIRAGVKHYIPADFGSCDSASPLTQELVPLYQRKSAVRAHLQRLADAHPAFAWTSLVCGHFFDWKPEFLHLWIRDRRADILDDGEARWSTSTLPRIAEATARVLLRPDAVRNRMIFVQSFLVSQKQVIAAFERATGGAAWAVTRYGAREFQVERKEKADAGDLDAVEDLVWLLGTVDGNWELRPDFAMKELGLVDEDLNHVVAQVVKQHTEA